MKLEIIVLVVVALFTAIFVYQSTSGEHEWAGADDQSEKVIDELTGGAYEPWSSPLWEPERRDREPSLRPPGGHRELGHRLFPGILQRFDEKERRAERRGRGSKI